MSLSDNVHIHTNFFLVGTYTISEIQSYLCIYAMSMSYMALHGCFLFCHVRAVGTAEWWFFSTLKLEVTIERSAELISLGTAWTCIQQHTVIWSCCRRSPIFCAEVYLLSKIKGCPVQIQLTWQIHWKTWTEECVISEYLNGNEIVNMGVKLGLSHKGMNTDWGSFRIECRWSNRWVEKTA
jgi:hypothetical protein